MNAIRIFEEPHPEQRVAAAVMLVNRQIEDIRRDRRPDNADYAEALRLVLRVEFLKIRIDEMELCLDTQYKKYRLGELRRQHESAVAELRRDVEARK